MTNQIIKQLFGSKNGVVVRALVFYECCQGLVPAWHHIRFGVLTIWQENLEVSVWSQMVSQFSGNSVQKLWSSFRGTPLFLFETQLWKLPFAKRSSFQSLISQKQLREIELQILPYHKTVLQRLHSFCKIHTNSASSEKLCCSSILRFSMFSFLVAESSLTYIF